MDAYEFPYRMLHADKTKAKVGRWKTGTTRGLFKPVENWHDAIVFANDNLNHDLGTYFTYADCNDRLNLLRTRFCVFRYVLIRHGVQYCPALNTLAAHSSVWDKIFEDKNIAGGSGKATIIVISNSDDYRDPIESSRPWLAWTEYNDRISENSINQAQPASDSESASRISGTRQPERLTRDKS
ncbi:hypothetical protein PHJA_002155000 [Phtheirospermum japonicum]|uniref:Uncharacterized protein n=1 Tax=Phtheirospermum japonicum TaxID=374723 RepID=A0A830CMB4_9LAMI|nr:hypothetical protein PHJA_002155000 [Phtheirospermum japonicum]